MQIPKQFFGSAVQAKASARKLAKAIVKARDFRVFEPNHLLNTSQVPGVVYCRAEWAPSVAPNFHCYALGSALMEETMRHNMRSFIDEWLLWSLDEAWRFPLVLSDLSRTGLESRDPRVLRKYVDASVRYWPMLRDAGKRFGPSGEEPTDVWEVWDNLRYALGNLGVPLVRLKQQLPDGGPAALISLVPN